MSPRSVSETSARQTASSGKAKGFSRTLTNKLVNFVKSYWYGFIGLAVLAWYMVRIDSIDLDLS